MVTDKTPFVCMKTVSCQTIEKTNRLSLKKKKINAGSFSEEINHNDYQ